MSKASPFRNARIVGDGVDPAVYSRSGGERGKPDFIVSRSDLVQISFCPNRWVRGYKEGATGATEFGTVMDCLLLDRGNFEKRVAIYPETYPAEGRKGEVTDKPWSNNSNFAKEWKKAQGEKIFLKSDEANDARIALAVLLSDPLIAGIIETARKQVFVMAEFEDWDTGLVVPVKGLIDIVPTLADFETCLIDFKTCASAAPGPWVKAVFAHHYHVQAALYLDLWNAATGEDRNDFRHILQENYSPWQVAKRVLSEEYLDLGRNRYLSALRKYCTCLERNEWPGYESEPSIQGFQITEPEPWMLSSTNMDAIGSWAKQEFPSEPLKQSEPVAAGQNQNAQELANQERIYRERWFPAGK